MATKRKIRWRVAIPMGICALLVVYLVVSLLVGLFIKKAEPKIYTVCGYSGSQTLSKVKGEDVAQPVQVKDFNIYGEDLNLYLEGYTIDMAAAGRLDGASLVLSDLCTGKQIRYAVSGLADSGIQLGQLSDGFYAVYVDAGGKTQRVYMDKALAAQAAMTTVVRSGVRRSVKLVADQKLFDEADQVTSTLDKPYLYIDVATAADDQSATAAEVYDVVINTSPFLVSSSDAASAAGLTVNGINQAAELYDMAQLIKTQLEASGLKVLILKSTAADTTSFYGTDGLLAKAYASKAKYMLNLDFAQVELGAQVIYSMYSSDTLAKAVQQGLAAGTKLAMNDVPVVNANPAKEYAHQMGQASIGYDGLYEIREAGGRQLLAGTISSQAERNASFSADSPYGLNAVTVRFISINNADEVNYWKGNKDLIAQAMSQALVGYLSAN